MTTTQIDFQAYLTLLAAQRERFSVPGLGTFVWHLERSHVDPRGGTITPPRPTLKFEPGLRYQAETVAFLRDHFSLTPAEAENLLKEIGRLASNYLRAASEVELWRMGKLKRIGGVYKFEPNEGATLPIAMDLMEVSLRAGGTPAVAPLSAAPTGSAASPSAEKTKSAKSKDTASSPKTAPEKPRARPVEKLDEEDDEYISPQPRRKRSWIPLVSGIILIVSLLVAATVWLMRRRQPPAPVEITLSQPKSTSTPKEGTPKGQTAEPSPSPASKPAPKDPAPTRPKAEAAPPKPAEKTEPTPKPTPKPAPSPAQASPAPSGPRYYIIVGSYPSRAEAEAQAGRFSGYTIEYLPGKDPGWVRIGLLAPSDKAEAQRKLKEIKAQVPDAWLYTAP